VNKQQREQITQFCGELESIKDAIEGVLADETEKRDNLEEHFSGSPVYEAITEVVNGLEEAIECVSSAIDSLEQLVDEG
jgi:hypothetical protein